MTVRCDLHVHSRFSVRPANWVTQRLDAPECYTEPKFIYEAAIQRGMTHVTITDHNNICGALELMDLGYDNTFVSAEITAKFPENNCKVHTLVYDITEDEFKEAMQLRDDLREMVLYLREAGLYHAIAHPLYSVNNKISQYHLEELLLLFDLIELNGFRSKDTNAVIRKIVDGLDDDLLIKLAEKHKLDEALTVAKNKAYIRGTDDHSGMFIACTYTENASGSDHRVLFENAKENITKGENGTAKGLSYSIYSVGYQHMDDKLDVKKYLHTDAVVNTVDKILGPELTTTGGFLYSAIRNFRAKKRKNNNDVKGNLFKLLSEIEVENVHPENAAETCFDVVSGVLDTTVSSMIEQLTAQLDSGNVFGVLQTFCNMGPLGLVVMPYLIGYFVFQQTRNFAFSLNIEDKIDTRPKGFNVVHFTDTFYEINGVAKTLRQAQAAATKMGLDYKFITCCDTESEIGEVVFKPVKTFPIPEYTNIVMTLPPLLEMLDYCYEHNFTHIHVATPGPVGIVAMIIAKILQKPLYATYHTAFPQYVEAVADDKFMTDTCWSYMRLFYNQCDKIFVPSQSLIHDLEDHGIDRSKMLMFPRGVDTERFCLPANKKFNPNIKLLYVGRISKEKNLDILAEAFKRLDISYMSLVVVGDGEYREEMEESLRGFPVFFTGYLEGEDLVKAYQEADVFVFPSTSDTFGNVILEAHACGIPAIVTDVGGPSENVIDGKTGVVVKGDDVDAFAGGILTMIESDYLQMGIDAREEVKERSFTGAFKEWIKLYE